MRSFTNAFGIRCLKDDQMQNFKIVKEESALLGWGRHDKGLLEKINNGTRVSVSFSFKYFEHLGHERIRSMFRFPRSVHDAASSFIDSIRDRYRVKSASLSFSHDTHEVT